MGRAPCEGHFNLAMKVQLQPYLLGTSFGLQVMSRQTHKSSVINVKYDLLKEAKLW